MSIISVYRQKIAFQMKGCLIRFTCVPVTLREEPVKLMKPSPIAKVAPPLGKMAIDSLLVTA